MHRKDRSALTAGVVVTVCIALMCAGPSFAQARTFTVRDAIEMQTFIDPYPFNPTTLAVHDIKFSPDKKLFGVVTQRGLLATNEVESTLWVFDTKASRRFLGAPTNATRPKPRAVARMAAVTNDVSITQLRWLSDSRLAFLGRQKTPDRSLFTVDVQTGVLKRLTPKGQDVNQFDIISDTVAYTVSLQKRALLNPSETVLTGRPLVSILGGESSDIATTFGRPSNLWISRNGKTSEVIDVATGKPIQLVSDILSLSPSRRCVVVTRHVDRIPRPWEAYEPAFASSTDSYRLKAFAPGPKQEDQLFWIKQYALVELDSGKVDIIDAPIGEALLYNGPKMAIWEQDSRRVLLSNTFLPLEGTEEKERLRRAQRPCVAVVDRLSHQMTCVASLKQSGLDQYNQNGTLYFLNDVRWDQSSGEVVLLYGTHGNSQDSKQSEDSMEVYRQQNRIWTRVQSDYPIVRAPVWIGIHQDLNERPVLSGRDWSGKQTVTIWDPNPQLRFIRFGEVSVYKWQDNTGRQWVGGLIKPPNYVPGQRYPLVIQTHGFERHQFMTVGTFSTAFAAQPLAALGIVVLQADVAGEFLLTPKEAAANVQGYESVIDHLAADGLVDPERVGLIGFSRTGYHTLQALTRRPKRFAAATIADSDFLGYMQLLLGVDVAGNTMKREGIAIYGSEPFRDGLKTWLQDAPAFNLDKIAVPVRIEVHDLYSVLMNWEVYAGLRLLDKPVDLIQLPKAVHIVTKPLERLQSEQGDVDWFRFWLNGEEDPDPGKAEQYARWRELRKLQQENEAKAKAAAVN